MPFSYTDDATVSTSPTGRHLSAVIRRPVVLMSGWSEHAEQVCKLLNELDPINTLVSGLVGAAASEVAGSLKDPVNAALQETLKQRELQVTDLRGQVKSLAALAETLTAQRDRLRTAHTPSADFSELEARAAKAFAVDISKLEVVDCSFLSTPAPGYILGRVAENFKPGDPERHLKITSLWFDISGNRVMFKTDKSTFTRKVPALDLEALVVWAREGRTVGEVQDKCDELCKPDPLAMPDRSAALGIWEDYGRRIYAFANEQRAGLRSVTAELEALQSQPVEVSASVAQSLLTAQPGMVVAALGGRRFKRV